MPARFFSVALILCAMIGNERNLMLMFRPIRAFFVWSTRVFQKKALIGRNVDIRCAPLPIIVHKIKATDKHLAGAEAIQS